MKEKEKGTSTRKSRKNKDFILLSEKDLKHTRLIDDIIFKIVIEKRKEVGEEILRIALGKDLSLEESSSQKNIASLAGKASYWIISQKRKTVLYTIWKSKLDAQKT